MTWTPWRFFLVAIAGWMNRRQQEVIEYLKEENRVLRKKLGHIPNAIERGHSFLSRFGRVVRRFGRCHRRHLGLVELP